MTEDRLSLRCLLCNKAECPGVAAHPGDPVTREDQSFEPSLNNVVRPCLKIKRVGDAAQCEGRGFSSRTANKMGPASRVPVRFNNSSEGPRSPARFCPQLPVWLLTLLPLRSVHTGVPSVLPLTQHHAHQQPTPRVLAGTLVPTAPLPRDPSPDAQELAQMRPREGRCRPGRGHSRPTRGSDQHLCPCPPICPCMGC